MAIEQTSDKNHTINIPDSITINDITITKEDVEEVSEMYENDLYRQLRRIINDMEDDKYGNNL